MATVSDPGTPEAPIDGDETTNAELPMTMAASVVLENLPKDAHKALETAGELEQAKGMSCLLIDIWHRHASITSSAQLRSPVHIFCELS